ncbi:MAG: hypothetical protein MI976_19325 [Pseudomonadales bacterium]|nr:hypothetical protein [Pseudomonadales bacterium]
MPLDVLLNHVNEFTKIAVHIAAVFAGAWAIYTYKKSKRSDATKRIYDLYNSFYTNENYFWARDTFEHEYIEVVAPLVEKRVTDRHIKLMKDEIENLRKLDLMFNFFEHLIYLEEQHILDQSDREVFFEYWFDFFAYPERGGLRRYFAKCGYERLALYTGSSKKEYIALSATQLKTVEETLGKLELTRIKENDFPEKFIETETRSNDLYTLFLLDNLERIRKLDKTLGYDPENIKNSEYIRANIRMKLSGLDTWVYVNER